MSKSIYMFRCNDRCWGFRVVAVVGRNKEDAETFVRRQFNYPASVDIDFCDECSTVIDSCCDMEFSE